MPRLRSAVFLVPALVSSLFLACHGDDSGPDGGGGQGGQGGFGGAGSSVTSITRTLGQDGGRLETTNVTLFVPSGALSKNTSITVSELDQDAIDALPQTTDNIKLSGIPAKFTPHGLTFDQPADVTMAFDEPADPGEPLAVLKLDNDQDNTWEYVPGAKFDSGSASFAVDGFSIYCVFADPDGVADRVYGPDVSGTGGTGSGGQGSGGETAGGGTGGGSSGGSAGSGSGGDPNLPGYLYTPVFHGFGETEIGPGATIASTDLATNPGPNCMSGQTGVNADDTATLFYYVNQGTDGTQQGPILVSDPGLRLDLDFTIYRSMMVELRGEAGSWCSWFSPEVPGPAYIPWEWFDSYNCDYTGGEYTFDPTADEIIGIGVRVQSNYSASADFDFCLGELTSGLPNGYMAGPPWMGFGFIGASGATTVVNDDLTEALAPNCIDGTTDPDPTAYAELGYALNTDTSSSNFGPVTVGGSGVAVDLINTPARDLAIHLQSATQEFCSDPQLAVASGVLEVAWDQFKDCSSGVAFASAPLDYISVRVLSSTVADDPYELCIESMDESP